MKMGSINASRRALQRAASLALESLEQRRFFSADALDPSYGTGGLVHTDFPGATNDRAADMVAFNGGLLTAGNASNRPILVKYTLNGAARDNSFGVNGQVSIPNNILDSASRVQIDASNKIVVAGSRHGVAAVARFLPNGALDTSFGAGGVVTQPGIGTNATAVRIAANGDVIISGDGTFDLSADPNSPDHELKFALARFHNDGSVDHGFSDPQGDDGFAVTDISSTHDASIADITMEGNQIVAVGTVDHSGANQDVEVARYNADGSLDASFYSGHAVTDLPGTRRIDVGGNPSANQPDFGQRVAIWNSGGGNRIVIGAQDSHNGFTAIRLDDTGNYDTNFGGDPTNHPGTAFSSLTGIVSGINVDAAGNIVLAGGATSGGLAAMRFNNAGGQDAAFPSVTPIGTASGAAAVVVNGGGAITLFGTTFNGDQADYAFVNLAPTGALVNTRTDGLIAPEPDVANVMAVGSDGSAIVAGHTSTDDISSILAITKYTPNGTLDPSFAGGKITVVQNDDLQLSGATSDGNGGAYLVGLNGGGTNVVVIHVTSSGTFDSGFGDGSGFATIPLTSGSNLPSVSIVRTSDGNILACGNDGSTGFVLKLDNTGAPVSEFGDSGTGLATVDLGGAFSFLTSITALSDHTILAAGTIATADGTEQLAAAHLDAQGNLSDQALPGGTGGFGNGGVAVGPDGSLMASTAIAWDAGDGSVYVGGGKVTDPDNNVNEPIVAKFDAAGNLDGSYGTGGVAEINVSNDVVKSMALQDGKINFVTSAQTALGTGSQVVRLNESGTVDTDGVAPVDTASPLDAVSLAIGANNRILVAGTLDGDFAVAALTAGATATPAPVAHAGADASVNEGGSLTFDGTHSTGDDLTYAWDLDGDGQFDDSTSATPSFTFADGDASIVVSLKVTDSSNRSDTDTLTVSVHNVAPTLSVTGTGTGSEGSSYTVHLTSNDPGADTISGWSINWGDGNTSTISGNPNSASHVYADNGNYTVNALATDEDGSYNAPPLAVAVSNVAPTLAVTGTGSSSEGSNYTVNLSASDPGSDTIASWTINWGDGQTDTIAGHPSTATHAYGDNGTYAISATATDEDGTFNATGHSVSVANVKPTAAVSGPSALQTGQSGTYVLGASDPSGPDMAANFTFQINWGDGSAVQTVVSHVGASVTHSFAAAGNYTVSVLATDKDNGTSTSPATTSVAVTNPAPPPPVLNAQLVTNPATGKTDLIISGSTGNDGVILLPGAGGAVNVLLGTSNAGSFSPTGRIVVNGGDGNDIIALVGLNHPVEVYGGAGNDIITASSAGDIIVGGDGNDLILGGAGRDLMIGGAGADTILGSTDDDILIAGTTSYDSDSASLNKILAEWNSNHSYANRLANLQGSNSNTSQFNARLNGNVFLRVNAPNPTVFDDAARDNLTGGSGQDWFLFNSDVGVRDSVTDEAKNETGSDID